MRLAGEGDRTLAQSETPTHQIGEIVECLGEPAAGLCLQHDSGGEEAIFDQPAALRGLVDRLRLCHAESETIDHLVEALPGRFGHGALRTAQRLDNQKPNLQPARHGGKSVREVLIEFVPPAIIEAGEGPPREKKREQRCEPDDLVADQGAD